MKAFSMLGLAPTLLLSVTPMLGGESDGDEESFDTQFLTRNVEISATRESDASERSHLRGDAGSNREQSDASRTGTSIPDVSDAPPPPPPPAAAPIDQGPVSELAVDYCSTAQGAADPGCGGVVEEATDAVLPSNCNIQVPLGGDNFDEIRMPSSAEQSDTFSDCSSGGSDPDTPLEQPDNAAPESVVPAPETEQVLELQDRLEEIPGTIEEEFASMPIQGGEIAFDEDLMGFGYRGEHTNIFLTTEPQEFTQELLGIEVQVRVEPERFQFDYGDGTVVITEQPGQDRSRHPADTHQATSQTPTSHIYEDTGIFQVQARTWFHGEFRIGEGTWQTIPGEAVIEATPGEADIWRVDSRHVSGECQDTQQWGCNGPLIIEDGDRPPHIFADQYDQNGTWTGP